MCRSRSSPRRSSRMPCRPVPPGTIARESTLLGGVLCVLGLGGPVFALIEEPQRGWSDPLILFSLIGGLVLFGLFVLWESRAAQPMLPLRLFARRNFSFANLETLSVYAGLSTLDVLPRPLPAAACGLHRPAQRFGPPPHHRRDVLAVAARRPPVDAVRPAVVHGRRPIRRRAGVDRRDQIAARILVLVGAPAFTGRLLDRPLDDRRTAHRNGACGRRRARCRDRERREQRRGARRGPAGDRRRRRSRRGAAEPARPGGLPSGDGDHRAARARGRHHRHRREFGIATNAIAPPQRSCSTMSPSATRGATRQHSTTSRSRSPPARSASSSALRAAARRPP